MSPEICIQSLVQDMMAVHADVPNGGRTSGLFLAWWGPEDEAG